MEKQTPCYACWILVIASGTFCGTTAADFLQLKLAEMALKESLNTTVQFTPPSIVVEQSKPKDGYLTAVQTCNFWREQYHNDPSTKNQTLMSTACARAKTLR